MLKDWCNDSHRLASTGPIIVGVMGHIPTDCLFLRSAYDMKEIKHHEEGCVQFSFCVFHL
jgi:hypothetical protein